MGEANFAPVFADVVRVCRCHEPEVHDASLGREKSRNASDVRLELGKALGADPFQSRHAVRLAAPMELFQTRKLRLVARDNYFAAPLERDAAPIAEADEFLGTCHTEARLERSGNVVDSAMEDTTVVAGLMCAGRGLLVKHGQAQP